MTMSYRMWLVQHDILDMDEVIIPVSVDDFIFFFYEYEERGCDYNDHTLIAAESTEHFASILSSMFSEHNILFEYKQHITELESETHPDGRIVIYISDWFFGLYKSSTFKLHREFYGALKNVLRQELVHREQLNNINIDKYKGMDIPDDLPEPQKNKKYLGYKMAMIAFARNIVDRLIRQFKTKHRLLQFLRNPLPFNSSVLDSYLINFKDDREVLDQLYKYMYQYIINDFNKKEIA